MIINKDNLTTLLMNLENKSVANKHQMFFFKNGADSYFANDKFLGITMPILRNSIKPYYYI